MNDYGIKISEAGKDVMTAADDELLISSEFPMFLINEEGTTDLKMYKTAMNGTAGSGDTTITVDSTTGFRSAGHFWVLSDFGFGELWEAIAYTGTTSTTFTGCTRGHLSTTAGSIDDNETVVAGYNEFSLSHGFDYPPVHFVFRDISGVKTTVPMTLSALGTAISYIDAYVTTSDLKIIISYDDFNAETEIPSGTYDQFDFVYLIMSDSITTPYY